MKRLAAALAIGLGLASPALSVTIEEQILASLESQGYLILEEGYTFLGRLRIVATNGEIRREIVVNPGTGEILRDYAVSLPRVATGQPEAGRSGGSQGASTSATSSGSGGGGAGSGKGVTLGTLGVTSTVGEGTTAAATDGLAGDGQSIGILMLDALLPFSTDTQ